MMVQVLLSGIHTPPKFCGSNPPPPLQRQKDLQVEFCNNRGNETFNWIFVILHSAKPLQLKYPTQCSEVDSPIQDIQSSLLFCLDVVKAPNVCPLLNTSPLTSIFGSDQLNQPCSQP